MRLLLPILLLIPACVGYLAGLQLGMMAPAIVFPLTWSIAYLVPGKEGALDCRPDEARSVKVFVQAITVLGVAPPLIILLHEFGHYLVATSLGYDAVLSHAEVSYSRRSLPSGHHLMMTIGGPMVEFLLSCVGVIGLFKLSKQPQSSVVSLSGWLFTACALAALRWIRLSPSQSGGDETVIARLLGLPPGSLDWLMIPWAFFVLFMMLLPHRKHQTLVPLALGFFVAVLSGVAWLTWVGPWLLPNRGP
jgi:hypothetical protein